MIKIGVFQAPSMRPTRTPRQVFDWVVSQAITADQVGATEYWIGEHATMDWESIPAPDYIIAAAANQTQHIILCPGAHLLPYHHPAALAVRAAWLSHITEGRYILGVGAGAYPSDALLHGIRDMSVNHKMMGEAIEIMEKVWKSEPFFHEGTYWNAGFPENDPHHAWRDSKPWGGSIQLAMAGISPNSPSIREAGRRGYIPMSFQAGPTRVANHWKLYEAAATEAGRTVDHRIMHVNQDIFVADTDAEAKRLAIRGPVGQAWADYILPNRKRLGLLKDVLIGDMTEEDVTLDYLAENVWVVGSPSTVVEKLEAMMEPSGGWGVTLVPGYDYIDDPAAWNYSLELLAREVAPRVEIPGLKVAK